MRRDTVNYTAVGLFVLAMLAVLGYTLFQLTGRHGAVDRYHVHYGNVAGIRYGTPVYFEGYGIGQVEQVEPEHGDRGVRYRVTLAVRRGWPIPEDSVAAVVSSGLLSDVTISILEGASAKPLAAGSEIRGRDGTDLFTAFSELASEVRALTQGSIRPLVQQLGETVGEGVAPIIADLRRLLEKLNQSADGLNQLLGPENRREVAAILQQINLTSANTRELTTQLLETRKQVDALLAEANGLIGENRPEVQQSVHELRVSLQAVSARIDTIVQQLDGTTRNLQEFSREIRANPGRLLADKPLQDQVEGTRR